MRLATAFGTGFLVAALALGAAAGERINKTEDGVAIKGYDPVAYFTMSRPVEGRANLTHTWQDAIWRFASERHRAMFASEPEAYAPRYGGHCTGAMARGVLWTIDPEAWAIVEGKLYLSFLRSGIADFAEDPEPIIERADANWERLGHVE